jgi:hypothetical protein
VLRYDRVRKRPSLRLPASSEEAVIDLAVSLARKAMHFEKFENSNVPQRGQPLAADPDRWHTHRRMFR